jgi:hypothetical protein
MNTKARCQKNSQIISIWLFFVFIRYEAGGQGGMCVAEVYRICFIGDSERGRQRFNGVST